MTGFLKVLAWTKLAQAKLWLIQCIKSVAFVCARANTITALTTSASVILLLRQCGANLIILLGHRVLSCVIGLYQKHCPMILHSSETSITAKVLP